MAGLFDTLNIGSRSLQAQRYGVDTAGHNLANVNTPGYARQRVAIESATTVSDFSGFVGAGADAVAILSIRDAILDQQVQSEGSITGSLQAQQKGLQSSLIALNDGVERSGSFADGVTTGLSRSLGNLFARFQALSASPVSTADRQALVASAQQLAQEFQQVDSRLGRLETSLDEELKAGVKQANALLDELAKINEKIVQAELRSPGSALDLRNSRQEKIEQLAQFVPLSVVNEENGGIALSVSGQVLVRSTEPVVHFQLIPGANGALVPALEGQTEVLQLTSGTFHGVLEVRDSALKNLRQDLNSLAASLIYEVNAIHSRGYSPTGSTGLPFFTGTTAADIAVNSALVGNPALIQASSSAAEGGDNKIILELVALGSKAITSLNGKTFTAAYASILVGAGQSLASANKQLEDQTAVESLLRTQRESISGVSIDEEVTNLVKFQKAFQASARFITVTDELLDTIINLT